MLIISQLIKFSLEVGKVRSPEDFEFKIKKFHPK